MHRARSCSRAQACPDSGLRCSRAAPHAPSRAGVDAPSRASTGAARARHARAGRDLPDAPRSRNVSTCCPKRAGERKASRAPSGNKPPSSQPERLAVPMRGGVGSGSPPMTAALSRAGQSRGAGRKSPVASAAKREVRCARSLRTQQRALSQCQIILVGRHRRPVEIPLD